MLEVRDLKVERGGRAILHVPFFSIDRGEVVSLVGPNGAGKTTMLLAVALLIKPSSGEIVLNGKRVGRDIHPLEYRRRLSFVFEEPLLLDATVYENVAQGLRFRGMKKGEIVDRVEKYLDLFRISHLRTRRARALSGGEAQRVALARAFAIEPEVLFLDEPFSSLDLPTRDTLSRELEAILGRLGWTVIMSTHERAEALRFSDRTCLIREGRIVQMGPTLSVMNEPQDEWLASFVGMETLLEGIVEEVKSGTFLVSVNGRIIEVAGTARQAEHVTICMRPEHVTISLSYPNFTSARNVFKAKVLGVEPAGFGTRVKLDCGFPLVAFVTASSEKALDLREGREVVASFKATSIHVLRRRPLG
jgi:tungstate transport system ATP-binding protein